ncbi:hypothetical protein OIU74_001507 [Salix koriyanagi]|uniref:Uncharacterized protein n=1 Tax=Salix koriyanagi TaxID=2511006 RepID=A0A9Q1AN44_9ROSI|nr:hypothetical protein OIU74_001507 [Salix koriyanagi]
MGSLFKNRPEDVMMTADGDLHGMFTKGNGMIGSHCCDIIVSDNLLRRSKVMDYLPAWVSPMTCRRIETLPGKTTGVDKHRVDKTAALQISEEIISRTVWKMIAVPHEADGYCFEGLTGGYCGRKWPLNISRLNRTASLTFDYWNFNMAVLVPTD